jgi:hypothetical protein
VSKNFGSVTGIHRLVDGRVLQSMKTETKCGLVIRDLVVERSGTVGRRFGIKMPLYGDFILDEFKMRRNALLIEPCLALLLAATRNPKSSEKRLRNVVLIAPGHDPFTSSLFPLSLSDGAACLANQLCKKP